ncbi:MAG TPA: phage tail protein [Candidatus Kapabacteria bacterium]|nr:phage tail protein [Candidatus Kapabacteria bacterium]
MADNFYPIGSVLPYAGPINQSSEGVLIAQGFIPCDGRPLSNTSPQYAALLQAIGGAYGQDATHFYVPDYRGIFHRGVDAGAGRDPNSSSRTVPRPDLPSGGQGNSGNNVGSLQAFQIASHTHQYSRHKDTHKCNLGSLIGPGVFTGGTVSKTSGETGNTETRPVNLYTNYVIRYQ